MIWACWAESITIRNWLVGVEQILLVDGSQNAIVPRPSGLIVYVPEN